MNLIFQEESDSIITFFQVQSSNEFYKKKLKPITTENHFLAF